jgi:hypothetical protein
MHIVEVSRRGADLGGVMAQMRTWVDQQRVEPSRFEVGFISGGEVRFRVLFRDLGEAAAFARAFKGDVLAGSGETAVAA